MKIESIGIVPKGIRVRPDTIELSSVAAEDCLERSRYDRREIDLLIYAGVYRTSHVCEPALSSMVAGQLALNDIREKDRPERTLCFDIFSGAVGVLQACHVASEALRSRRHRRVMIVASEVENNAEDSGAQRLGLRQAASAMIVDSSDGNADAEGFGAFTFRYFPEHIGEFQSYVDLRVAAGALTIHKSPALEEVYLNAIDATLREHLEQIGIERSRIKAIFAPQISSQFLQRLGQRIGGCCPVIDVTAEGGDLYTSSIPYALAHARVQGFVQSGDIGLITSVGAGIQAACVLYYF